MPETGICPKCGAVIPADAPSGVCPKCLMEQGLETTAGLDHARPESLAAGQRFGGYRVGQLLGQGGMGAVYEAEHLETGRHVALKVLSHQLESPEHRRRFLREGRLAAAINHPNNVYIYGTEEIDGVPVISMELARGGTLRERVANEGPLPIGEAVDLILEIIAGLEAAERAGVLHRDVKPSNCFFGGDGTVKVGDYGLSISTSPRADTYQTETGVFLGTPAFSSPEQLRGDELDVRSDIYSVGVTLYFLLTGKTPFHGKQMVQLLATVLERPAPSARVERPEVPQGLAHVVLRCLAKQSRHRYGSYDELRQALLPYTSQAPTPGTLGFRFVASAADFIAISSVAALLPLLWVHDFHTWEAHFDALSDPAPQESSSLMLTAGFGLLLHLCYYSLLEGVWGASLGKALCGLSVVRQGSETPGLRRALFRTALFLTPMILPWWIWYGVDPQRGITAAVHDDWRLMAICLVLALCCFSTVRRRNGFAAVHDLLSGTRVIRTRRHQQRPTLESRDEPLPEAQNAERIGPYHLLGRLTEADPDWILAYDDRLLRQIWIRTCSPAAPAVDATLRGLSRVGRLRWLSGERDGDLGWDAYEAPTGRPLLSLLNEPNPWDAVRFWLADLAEELSASDGDSTLPKVLELDRIWITEDGRAKLLDFPAPGSTADQAADAEAPRPTAETSPGCFLKRVAIASLEGKVVDTAGVAGREVLAPLPVQVRPLLNGLDGVPGCELPVGELASFTRSPAAVSLGRRLGAFAACWVLPILMVVYAMAGFYSEAEFLEVYPEVGVLNGYVDYYQSLQDEEAEQLRQALEVVTVHRFRSTIEDPEVWSQPLAAEFVDAQGQQLLARFANTHAELTAEQVATAARRVEPFQDAIRHLGWTVQEYEYGLLGLGNGLIMLAGAMLMFVVLPSLLSALLLGNTLLLWGLEIAVVTNRGTVAPRARVVWRSVVLWTIALAALAALIYLASGVHDRTVPWRAVRIAAVFLVYGTVKMFLSERGLHDMLAGTWLVPR